MLRLFDAYANLFKSWRVVRFEQEKNAHLLQISAILQDGSCLEIRDYSFSDGSRKYAYQWMNPDDELRRRWDNAPHWPDISTAPHHVHLLGQENPNESLVTNIEDLLKFLEDWFSTH